MTGRPPTGTFHARVAGAALVTALVILAAACLTFMLQQWVVAREQAHQNLVAMATASASGMATPMSRQDLASLNKTAKVLASSPNVRKSRLIAADGTLLVAHSRAMTDTGADDVVSVPVLSGGHRLGELILVAEKPALGAMVPQFLALTGALLFAGFGVALFLARSLAQRVIAPVQRLSSAMQEVAASGSYKPVDSGGQDAMFASLTQSFNHLLIKLDEREGALRHTLGELVVARDAADAANVLKSQFLANMSHEIRTPLNGVLAMAEVMSMGELADVQRERLDVVRQSGDLLLAVLNDVLDLSKIEAGNLRLLAEDFDLERAIAPPSDNFGALATQKDLAFEIQVAPSAKGGWRGDPNRLRQILGNLLSNAVKFTHVGKVSAVFESTAQGLSLTVADTGVGIPRDKQPTLFDKFVQADNSATRRFGGTGLGLAICRELTQMMGGTITVESQEGQGSLFRVDLPLARAQVPIPKSIEPAAIVDGDEGALRLLAAEDNPTNQQVLAAVMGSLGIAIDIVGDGRQALEAWRDGSYDLILMDIQMPVMDGMEAARAIREIEAHGGRRKTPILALTANALSHQVEEYLAAGMDGHVAKPIEIAKLYDAISKALNDVAQAGTAPAQAAVG